MGVYSGKKLSLARVVDCGLKFAIVDLSSASRWAVPYAPMSMSGSQGDHVQAMPRCVLRRN